MKALTGSKRAGILLLGLAVALLPSIAALPAPAQAQAATGFADPAFQRVWMHCDLPVESNIASRTWMWGPSTIYTGYEPYQQGPGGQHLVQYFDKSRMEINDPAGNRDSEWFVTNGLLVVDMISGQAQVGDRQFVQLTPSTARVAGDQAASSQAPTYAALRNVASLNGEHRAASRVGQPVREGLGPDGNVGILNNLAGYTTYAVYEPTTGHNIPGVFWTFMNQRGVTYHDGRYIQNDVVVDWLFAMGYPITEPYWISINVDGQERWVLMQAFQRRILTFSPQNAVGWQVEMGNVGRAYYDWRYGQQPAPVSTPTPTPKPKPAPSISIDPSGGDVNTPITVWGRNFPAYATVTLTAENAGANYAHTLRVVNARSDGSFQVEVTLPSETSRFGTVNIVATANGGGIRVSAQFKVSYQPGVYVEQREVVANGPLQIEGDGYPANTNIQVGALYANGAIKWLDNARSDSSGGFTITVSVGGIPVGTTFRVVGVASNGVKATSPTYVTVIAQPHLSLTPASGPVNAYVTLRGTQWPPGRSIQLREKAVDLSYEVLLATPATADAYGNFTVQLYIDPAYAGHPNLRISATEPISGVRVEVGYTVTTPASNPPTVVANPSVLAIGQSATVAGSNWQAGGIIYVGVGRPGYGVEEWLTSATATGNRDFTATIVLGERWRNAGQLTLTAQIPNNKSATTTIWVSGDTGRIVPSGLPMSVKFTSSQGTLLYKVSGTDWQPNSVVHINVVSANASVNTDVGMVVVKNNGTFEATFDATPWLGRPDLGVRAHTLDEAWYSVRYLPVTTMTKVQGSPTNAHRMVGFNWPPSTTLQVVFQGDGAKSGEQVLRTITTDAYGSFDVTLDVPKQSPGVKNDVEIRGTNSPYSAVFDQ